MFGRIIGVKIFRFHVELGLFAGLFVDRLNILSVQVKWCLSDKVLNEAMYS